MKNLAKIAVALVALGTMAGTAVISPAFADRIVDIKARGRIIVGVSDTTPPFSFKKPGGTTVIGYDIDIVQAMARRVRPPGSTPSRPSARPR